MVNGDVSIAVRWVYPSQRSRTLPSGVSQEMEKSADNVVPRTQNLVGRNCHSDIRLSAHEQAYELCGRESLHFDRQNKPMMKGTVQ